MKEVGRSSTVLGVEFVVLGPEVTGSADVVCKLVKVNFLS